MQESTNKRKRAEKGAEPPQAKGPGIKAFFKQVSHKVTSSKADGSFAPEAHHQQAQEEVPPIDALMGQGQADAAPTTSPSHSQAKGVQAPRMLPPSLSDAIRAPQSSTTSQAGSVKEALQSISRVGDSFLGPDRSHVSQTHWGTGLGSTSGKQAQQLGLQQQQQQQGEGSVQQSQGEASSPDLSDEQERVLSLVQEGGNVFFTGNAGTGKTFLLSRILTELRLKFGDEFGRRVAICAPTGIAATHIQGTTLNSALGIGLPTTHKDFGSMHKQENRAKIQNYQVLIIDEASMLSAEMWEKIEEKIREIKGNPKPAGGLQLIVCGDFFQLPPVSKPWMPGMPPDLFMNWGWAFQSPAWRRCEFEHVLLTKVFRQKDESFVRVLDDVRYGRNPRESIQTLLSKCKRPLPVTNGIKPTKLFGKNADVDDVNAKELAQLPGMVSSFTSQDEVEVDRLVVGNAIPMAEQRLQRHEFFRDCLAMSQVAVKVGAQVMLLKNIDLEGDVNGRQLVNGSRGVVTAMVPKATVLRRMEQERRALATTIPDRGGMLGGQSQAPVGGGPPPEALVSHPNDVSDQGMKMGNLSRSIESLRRWSGTELPRVLFLNGAEVEVLPAVFSASLPNVGTVRRVQVPLKLAWAITIHKSQGLGLDRLQVSLKNMFQAGQCYVALSRARSLEGLEILDLDYNCIKTDPLVVQFYEAMSKGQDAVKELLENDKAWEQEVALRRGNGTNKSAWQGSGAWTPSASSWQSRNGAGGSQYQSGGGSGAWGGRGAGGSYYGGGMGRGRGGGFSGGSSFGGGRGRGGDTCFKCGQTGHWASQCPGRR